MGFFFQAFFPRVREPADGWVTCTPSPRAKAAVYAGVQVGSGAGFCHVNRARALDTRGHCLEESPFGPILEIPSASL